MCCGGRPCARQAILVRLLRRVNRRLGIGGAGRGRRRMRSAPGNVPGIGTSRFFARFRGIKLVWRYQAGRVELLSIRTNLLGCSRFRRIILVMEHRMPHAKKQVRELLDRLPDGCSLEDILYHLYVFQKIGDGLADADAGRVIPHEQVEEELRQKWQLGRTG